MRGRGRLVVTSAALVEAFKLAEIEIPADIVVTSAKYNPESDVVDVFFATDEFPTPEGQPALSYRLYSAHLEKS